MATHRAKTSGMYTLAVKRDFVAQHFLVGGDWGAENFKHSHHYVLEVHLKGETLDKHGYLVDIVDVEKGLEALVASYRDKTLNELPEFEGLNPSIEHFTRIVAEQLVKNLSLGHLSSIDVKIWENEIAWASYSLRL